MTLHVDERPIQDAYQQRVNRDRRVRELKELGFTVKRTSMKSAIVHPDYIKDYDGPKTDKTYFAVIYIVEGVRR